MTSWADMLWTAPVGAVSAYAMFDMVASVKSLFSIDEKLQQHQLVMYLFRTQVGARYYRHQKYHNNGVVSSWVEVEMIRASSLLESHDIVLAVSTWMFIFGCSVAKAVKSKCIMS